MSIKLSDKCEQCGKSIKRFHMYKTQTLCGMCYRSHFMIINQPRIFDEPFDTNMSFSIALTKSQNEMVNERVKFLFPNKRQRSKYLRMLLLGDLMNWEKDLKKKRKETKED